MRERERESSVITYIRKNNPLYAFKMASPDPDETLSFFKLSIELYVTEFKVISNTNYKPYGITLYKTVKISKHKYAIEK
jgi:hypothetical protein